MILVIICLLHVDMEIEPSEIFDVRVQCSFNDLLEQLQYTKTHFPVLSICYVLVIDAQICLYQEISII